MQAVGWASVLPSSAADSPDLYISCGSGWLVVRVALAVMLESFPVDIELFAPSGGRAFGRLVERVALAVTLSSAALLSGWVAPSRSKDAVVVAKKSSTTPAITPFIHSVSSLAGQIRLAANPST